MVQSQPLVYKSKYIKGKQKPSRVNCTVWFIGNTSAYMSNETGLFSSLLNETMAADSKEEERVGGYSQEIALNSLWKYLSCTEKLKNKFRYEGQHLFFASRSIFHYRKKHTGQSQHFPLYSRSQLAHSGEASSEPVILRRAEPCFIVHGTYWKGAIVDVESILIPSK